MTTPRPDPRKLRLLVERLQTAPMTYDELASDPTLDLSRRSLQLYVEKHLPAAGFTVSRDKTSDARPRATFVIKSASERAESLGAVNRAALALARGVLSELFPIEGTDLDQLGIDVDALPDDPRALDQFEPSAMELAAIDARLPKFSTLQTLPLGDDAVFSAELSRYALTEGIDLDADPVASLLAPRHAANVRDAWRRDFARLSWDRWDYALVGGAAVLGALVDVALVSVPKDCLWKGVRYTGGPLTRILREKSAEVMSGDGWLSGLQRALETWAKVPYDISINNPARGIVIDGLRPSMHRIMSPGHDPVLGFIFGILDLLRGTCTLIDRHGATQVIANGDGVSLWVAIVVQIAHLLSDLPTSTGLPPPFFTLLQKITASSSIAIGPSGKAVSVADLTRWMYGQGYDLRHVASMSVVPLIVESVVRLGFFARHHDQLTGQTEAPINLTLKRDEMLFAAHAMTASTNAMKVAMAGGNPLAINPAVWMATTASTLRWMNSASTHDQTVHRELLAQWSGLSRSPISSLG